MNAITQQAYAHIKLPFTDMLYLILNASIPAERSTSIIYETIINFYCEVYGSNLTLSPFALALLVCKMAISCIWKCRLPSAKADRRDLQRFTGATE